MSQALSRLSEGQLYVKHPPQLVLQLALNFRSLIRCAPLIYNQGQCRSLFSCVIDYLPNGVKRAIFGAFFSQLNFDWDSIRSLLILQFHIGVERPPKQADEILASFSNYPISKPQRQPLGQFQFDVLRQLFFICIRLPTRELLLEPVSNGFDFSKGYRDYHSPPPPRPVKPADAERKCLPAGAQHTVPLRLFIWFLLSRGAR